MKYGLNDLPDDLFFWLGEFVTHKLFELVSNIKYLSRRHFKP